MTAPPRLARLLARAFAGKDDARFVLEDLSEEFDELAATKGPAAARDWYRRQVVRSLAPLARSRVRGMSHAVRRLGARIAAASPARVAADAGLALRKLRARPAFAAMAIGTLALGIGGPTATFSVVRGVLLRPLPYPNPDRVVRFQMHDGAMSFDALPVSLANDWIATSSTLASVAIFNDRSMTLSTSAGPYRLDGAAVTPNLFELLGVPPALGHIFSAGGGLQEILLADAAWRKYFGADASIVGQPVIFDGVPFRVAGVMPAQFVYPTPDAAFWVAQDLAAGGGRGLLLPVIARLRPGVTVADAEAEGNRLMSGPNGGARQTRLEAQTLQDQMVGGVRRLLWLLMASVTLVFVIATVNIALLLLTDGHARQREFAVRLAIGASRPRLVRQLFTEGATLALLGGACGIALAAWLVRLFTSLAPASMPRVHDVALDRPVLLFAIGASVLTSISFGVLSAGKSVAFDVIRVLAGSNESRLAAGGGSRRRLKWLAAVEIALAMVLLTAAGLLVRSFVSLALVPQGFNRGGAVAFQINLPASRYPDYAARLILVDQLLGRLRAVDGAMDAGIATAMPNRQPTGRFSFTTAEAEGPPAPFSNSVYDVRWVSEGFIEALGVPVVDGRAFRLTDTAGAERVMMISQSLARQLFPDGHAVGRLIYEQQAPLRVVGVVGDVRAASDASKLAAAAYLPMRQLESPQMFDWWTTATVAVRGRRAVTAPETIRSVALGLDAGMPPFNVRTLDEEVSNLTADPRFDAALLSLFGIVALVLAALGIYGVMSHAASLRTHEIGVRIALGAAPSRMVALLLREGVPVIGAGITIGGIASMWLTRALTGLLYEVRPADPIAIFSVAVLLGGVGCLASLIPARRATRVSALVAMRAD